MNEQKADKKLKRILKAVSGYFASPPKRKKLRKESAFVEFIQQMEEKRDELEAEHRAEGTGPVRRSELEQDLMVLDRQIGKAKRLLGKLREDE